LTGEFDGGSVVSVAANPFALALDAAKAYLARLNGPFGDAVAVSLE
jgi:hypothetical protein